MSAENLGYEWVWVEAVAAHRVALPKEPERPELADAAKLAVADEFGDAYAILWGELDQLPAALGLVIDQLYEVEWGTSDAPELEPAPDPAGEAEVVGFGEDYLAVWRALEPGVILIGVARPERSERARAFVAGATRR